MPNTQRHGRKKPYTEIGVKRLPCVRCGEPAFMQWKACADGLWRPICKACDFGLNELVLGFMKDTDYVTKLEKYAKELHDA